MDVRIAYDDDVLYVGARMFSTDGRIQAPLGRRDNVDQAEHILVSFDTFLDRRTAVVFGVTAAGVRIDRYHSSDNEDSFDAGFDPVWRAETSVSGDQWTRGVVDSVLAAALQPAVRSDLGPQPVSLQADAERRGLLDPDPADGAGVGVAVRRGQRHQRRRAAAAHRGAAVHRRRLDPHRCRRPGQSVRRWAEPAGAGRRRRQDGPWAEPHARDRDQSRFRAGRGRPRRGQPDRLRDALPREAPVLPRGRAAVQHRPSEFLLLAADRPHADWTGDRRLRGLSHVQHHSRRRQADRAAAVEDVARVSRRRH